MKATLKSVLLAQLETTHDEQNWFVPVSKAVAGLTAEQAVWKDGKGNHSIAELVSHLIFWNESNLAKYENPPGFDTFVTAMSIAYGLMIASVILPRRYAAIQPTRVPGAAARESQP